MQLGAVGCSWMRLDAVGCGWMQLGGNRTHLDAPRCTHTGKSQWKPVSGGATEQDSDISQRMSSPTPLSEPEIIVELRFLTVNDEDI